MQVYFISLDPARDTLARLSEYLHYFDPRMIGATGSAEELSPLVDFTFVLLKDSDPLVQFKAAPLFALLLEACDRVSVSLCGALGSPFEVTAKTPTGDAEEIVFQRMNDTSWRVRPWPLEGDRLRLQVEGRRLPTTRFASAEEMREALARAPARRLTFTLMRPSAG